VTWTLPDADGTDGQVIKTNGTGTLSWITPSAGGGGTSVTVTQITATAAQTDFSVTYTVGQLSVYLNGALLASGDFTASNGTTVVLAAGAASGDIFTALAYDSATQITEGDSSVVVTDSGTGKVEVTVDNVEVADFTTGAIVFNETGANQDFRVEGDTDANLLFVDASADAVSIGGNFLFNSGYGSAATAYGCRAWVNFNGNSTVSIRGSGNVSSITDTGTGQYTVNFTTSMPDANYNAQMSCKVEATHTSVSNNLEVLAAGNIQVAHFENALHQDCSVVCVSIFR
jgi:hypothetical protein